MVVNNEKVEEREVCAFLNSGCEEILQFKKIFDFLELPETAIILVVITDDGRHSPVRTSQVNLIVEPLSRTAKYKLSDVLVMSNFTPLDLFSQMKQSLLATKIFLI